MLTLNSCSQYSTTGNSYGPYTDTQQIVATEWDPVDEPGKDRCNYSYHSYPKFYPASTTSHKLIASWSYAYGSVYKMGIITLS